MNGEDLQYIYSVQDRHNAAYLEELSRQAVELGLIVPLKKTLAPTITTTLATIKNGKVGRTQVTAHSNRFPGKLVGYRVSVSPRLPQRGDVDRNWTVKITLFDGYDWPSEVTGPLWNISGNIATRIFPTKAVKLPPPLPPPPKIEKRMATIANGVVGMTQVTASNGGSLAYNVWVIPNSEQPGDVDRKWEVRLWRNHGFPWPSEVEAPEWDISDNPAIRVIHTEAVKPPTLEETSPPEITTSLATVTNGAVGKTQVTASAVGPGYTVKVAPQGPLPGDADREWVVTMELQDGYVWSRTLKAPDWSVKGKVATQIVPTKAVHPKKTQAPTITKKPAKIANGIVGKSQVTASPGSAGYSVKVSPDIPMPGDVDQDWTLTLQLQDGYAWPGRVKAPDWTIHGSVATTTIRTDAVKIRRQQKTLPPNILTTLATVTNGVTGQTQVTASAVGPGYTVKVTPDQPVPGHLDQEWFVVMELQNGYEWHNKVKAPDWSVKGKWATQIVRTPAVHPKPTQPPTVSTIPPAITGGVVGNTQVTAVRGSAGYRVSVSPEIPMPGDVDRNWNVSIQLQNGYGWPNDVKAPEWTIQGNVATKTIPTKAVVLTPPPPLTVIRLPVIRVDPATYARGAAGTTQVIATAAGPGYQVTVTPSTPMPGDVDRDWSVVIRLEDGYAWPSGVDASEWTIQPKVATRVIRTPAVMPPTYPSWVFNHYLWSLGFAVGSSVLGLILLFFLADGVLRVLGILTIPVILLAYLWFEAKLEVPR